MGRAENAGKPSCLIERVVHERGSDQPAAGSLWYYYLVMARATFSLDEATIAEIKRTAERLRKPQSHVIREAVADYAARTDRLSERERRHLLDVLEGLRGAKPARSASAVDHELEGLRQARRGGGRRHSS
jgi:predicted transcriptional regulator